MRKNNTYAERRAEGLCGYCGKKPAAPGYVTCDDCREKKRMEYWKARKAVLAKQAQRRAQEKDKRQRSLAPLQAGQRRCHDCGAPTYDYRCEECRNKWRIKNGVAPRGTVADAEYDIAI